MTQRTSGREAPGPRRKRLLIRRPYPTHSLQDTLAAAEAIRAANGGQPLAPDRLAAAMGTTRGSSAFRMKLTSSVKYGLTEGGVNDEVISLTPLGEAAVSPRSDGERRGALLDAACNPDVFGGFYDGLDGQPLPRDDYSRNVLEREWGIDPSISAECIDLIRVNGQFVGILTADSSGALSVDLSGAAAAATEPQAAVEAPAPSGREGESPAALGMTGVEPEREAEPSPPGRVYLGYQVETEVVEFVKDLLQEFGIPYSSVDDELDSTQPVSPRVSEAMKSCNSAILVLTTSPPGQGPDRMMFHVGAASALYSKKVVVLCENDTQAYSPFAGLETIDYSRDRPEDVGLALLMSLRDAGIIRVVT